MTSDNDNLRPPSLKEMLNKLPSNNTAPTSEQAAEAYKSITTYGQAFAKYVEQLGTSILQEAEAYNSSCIEFAARIRETSEAEATRAVQYLNKINALAKELEQTKNNYIDLGSKEL